MFTETVRKIDARGNALVFRIGASKHGGFYVGRNGRVRTFSDRAAVDAFIARCVEC